MGGNQIGFLSFLNNSTSTLRVEFVHYDLGTRTVVASGGDAVGGAYVNRFRTQGNVIKFGLGYLFGTASAAPGGRPLLIATPRRRGSTLNDRKPGREVGLFLWAVRVSYDVA